jgi:hypothetical protein
MTTKDLINALIFALADKEIVKQLDAALSRSNVSLTGFKIEKLLELYKRGSLKGQQHTIYTDMMQAPSQFDKVAETAIVQHSGRIVEAYSAGMPLDILLAVTESIENDLALHIGGYEEELR